MSNRTTDNYYQTSKKGNVQLSLLLLACIELNDDNFNCFFEFSAHVNDVEVRLFPQGWHHNTVLSFTVDLSLDSVNVEQDIIIIISELHAVKKGNMYAEDSKYFKKN